MGEMEKKYVLVVDEGTTGLRAHLFNQEMNVVGQHYEKIDTSYPAESAVEQDPMEIYNKTVLAMRKAVEQSGISAEEIRGIGITPQRSTWMLFDKVTGEPLYNFIVWLDTRGIYSRDKFLNNKEFCEKFPRLAGSIAVTAGSAFSISDHLQNTYPAFKKALENPNAVWGLVDTWLIFKLTGGKVHACCASMASACPLYSIHENQWEFDALPYINMRKEMMPEIKNEIDDYGVMTKDILGVEIPIMADIADQQSALFSEACLEPGTAKCTIGTGAFMDINIGKDLPEDSKLTLMHAWRKSDHNINMLEGMLFTAGACLEWGKNNMGIIEDFGTMDEVAEAAGSSAGICFVPGINGMDGLPFNNPTGRGSFMGLTADGTKANLVRALLEGIAFSVAYMFDYAVESLPHVSMKQIMLDGGVSRSNLICQTIATLTGAKVIRPLLTEATALGAAEQVAISAGWFKEEDVPGFVSIGSEFVPFSESDERAVAAQKQYRMWKKAVERSKDWIEV